MSQPSAYMVSTICVVSAFAVEWFTVQRTESCCFDKVPFFPMEAAVTVQVSCIQGLPILWSLTSAGL